MNIPDFELERYFARWEFTAPYLLCSSDLDGYRLEDLLVLADEESRRLWNELSLGYTECPGHPLLRAEIAAHYQSVTPDKILTFAGAEEAIFVFMNAFLEPGDHIIVTWPGYQPLYEVARFIGAEVTLLPLDSTLGWVLNLESLQSALQLNTRLIVVNFPHNPTGALLDHNAFSALIELVEKANAYLFSDEVYRLLEYNEADRLPAAVECSARTISLGSMSKVFGMAGVRIGWLATHDTGLLQRMTAFKDYTSTCNSAPSEILALIALRARETIVARNRKILTDNLNYLDRFFARWTGVFEWIRPKAGSIAFPRLRTAIPIEQFTTELVEQQGVMLLPETVYAYHNNHFRLGFGRRNLPEALSRFEEFAMERLHILRQDRM
jgi:aspartate/methionine/tyrosine aminotransferase